MTAEAVYNHQGTFTNCITILVEGIKIRDDQARLPFGEQAETEINKER